jgi:tetratricopeptide (TPR) repeat protein
VHRIVKFAVILYILPLFFSCTKKDDISKYPVLGTDSIFEVKEMEDQSESLIDWAKRGYSDMIVIHVDTRDDLGFIPEERIEEIRRFIEKKDWESIEKQHDRGAKGLFLSSDYLYAASRLGIVKEVYWVLPHTFFDKADAGTLIKRFLNTNGSLKDKGEVDAMAMKQGCLAGRLKGVMMNICGPDTMPFIQAPIVLDIDVNFFPPYSSERTVSMLRGLKIFFDNMNMRNYRIASANIAYSINSGYLRPIHRYIGPEVIEAVSNPQLLKRDTAPELWSARDNAETLIHRGEKKLAVDSLRESMKKFPDDTVLRAFYINAIFLLGKYNESLEGAKDLCKKDERECSLLVYLGGLLAGTENAGESDRFYNAAFETRPGWSYAHEEYGKHLLDQGRFEEARDNLAVAAEGEDDINLRLRMGDVEYEMENKDEALKHYETAMDMYHEKIGLSMNKENIRSLDRMTELYTKAGRTGDADRIIAWKKRLGLEGKEIMH